MADAALKTEKQAVAKRKTETDVAVSEDAAIFSMIERVARDPSVDVGRMRELMTMQKEAAAARARTAFLAAFARLQADLPAVERKGTGHNQKKYARFEDLIETIKAPLAEHGFSLSFRLRHEAGVITVSGVLGHEGGHQEATELPLPPDKSGGKSDVHAMGSSISYGKRYVAMTLLGIATEDEDDDGKAGGRASAPEPITAAQVAEIRGLMERAKVDAQIIYEHFSVSNLEELTPAQHATAVNKLKKKLEL